MSVIPDIKIYLYLILIFPFPFSHYINRGRRLVLYARRSIVSSAGEIWRGRMAGIFAIS